MRLLSPEIRRKLKNLLEQLPLRLEIDENLFFAFDGPVAPVLGAGANYELVVPERAGKQGALAGFSFCARDVNGQHFVRRVPERHQVLLDAFLANFAEKRPETRFGQLHLAQLQEGLEVAADDPVQVGLGRRLVTQQLVELAPQPTPLDLLLHQRQVKRPQLRKLILAHASRTETPPRAVRTDPVWVVLYFGHYLVITGFNAESTELALARVFNFIFK